MVFFWPVFSSFAQTVLVNYDFNSGTSDATLTPALAPDITSAATNTEAWQTYAGTASGAQAFVANATPGNARGMANSSGTNTKYYEFALGGTALTNFSDSVFSSQAIGDRRPDDHRPIQFKQPWLDGLQ
jgi:hypothetical protein